MDFRFVDLDTFDCGSAVRTRELSNCFVPSCVCVCGTVNGVS